MTPEIEGRGYFLRGLAGGFCACGRGCGGVDSIRRKTCSAVGAGLRCALLMVRVCHG